MLFTSISFPLFLSLIFLLYWFVFNKNLKAQNFLLLIGSYIFYAWFDWRFLLILFLISVSNYFIAILIQKNDKKQLKKLFYVLGLVINIGTLIIFKYFNFFVESFIKFNNIFGFNLNAGHISLFLPIGISFYIFLSLSYIIDVYQNKLIAVKNICDVLLTLSFFPIILAGPIHRPIKLLPQIQNERRFRYTTATDGLKQILWGLFMKIVIADNCSQYVDIVFNNFIEYSGSTLVFGVLLFAVQIYADFAGYSNIAIGIGKLLGFEIVRNFAFPYFSRDIKEFWQRWNISLTNWFRDYVFLPIAYFVSKKIKSDKYLLINTNVLIYIIGISITWILTGLWHGANYTFIIWGLINGFSLLIFHLTYRYKKGLISKKKNHNFYAMLILLESIFTFSIVTFSWIFFRSNSVSQAFEFISEILSPSFFTIPEIIPFRLIILISIFFIIEWFGRDSDFAIANIGDNWPITLRWSMYYSLTLAIFLFGGKEQQFIYFSF